MSKDHLEVISANQAERIDRIKQYHTGCVGAFGQQMGYAFLCGLELNAAKGELPHGSFMEWHNRYLPQLSKGSVQRYMAFATTLRGEITHAVGNLDLDKLRLANGELPEKEKEAVLKAVHKVADGKTLTELYRDLGVIRQPKKPQHHPVKLTPEEQLQADLAAAEAAVQSVRSDIAILRECEEAKDRASMLAKVKPDSRRALLAEALWLTKTLRRFNKGRKPRK